MWGLCPFGEISITDFWNNYKDLFRQIWVCLGSLFSQATAANERVNLVLVGADMDRSRFCVHYGGVAGGNACNPVHGMPFAACGGWIKDVGAVTGDHACISTSTVIFSLLIAEIKASSMSWLLTNLPSVRCKEIVAKNCPSLN